LIKIFYFINYNESIKIYSDSDEYTYDSDQSEHSEYSYESDNEDDLNKFKIQNNIKSIHIAINENNFKFVTLENVQNIFDINKDLTEYVLEFFAYALVLYINDMNNDNYIDLKNKSKVLTKRLNDFNDIIEIQKIN
jgi:hypothetical protein